MTTEDWEQRIAAVLGEDNERCERNACRYMKYLQGAVKLPLRVTGIEDFDWEEPYVFGVFPEEEYEEMKLTNPSYTDEYDLLDILEPDDVDLTAIVKRVSDGKSFEIDLSWLKCVDATSPEYVALDDYSVWFVNY